MSQKPKVKRFNFGRILIMFALGVSIALLGETLAWSKWVTLLLIFTVLTSFSIAWPFYVIYKTNQLKLVDRYIINNAKRPIFSYAYEVAYGTEQDIIDTLKSLLSRYPQAEMQVVYKGNLAIHQKDAKALIAHANQLEPSEYRAYFLAIGYAMENKMDEARNFISKLSSPWAIYSAKAYLAAKEKDRVAFDEANTQLQKVTRGMQKYVAYHNFNRVKQERFKE